MPVLDADQAETTLGRLREAEYGPDDPLVASLLARLGETGGVRRRNRVAKWFDYEATARDERRAARQQHGTLKEQRSKYRDYVQQLARAMEAGTRGQPVTAAQRGQQARGTGMSLERILTSTPDTMRKHLSQESLEWLAREHGGPPLSFDAWRYSNLGARDRDAVASWQRRTGGFFSEHG